MNPSLIGLMGLLRIIFLQYHNPMEYNITIMKPEEIRLFISEGEGLAVEFKEKYTSKIAEDIVAFSNAKGGYILLGVNDQGKVTGEVLTNRLRGEITTLARNCEPHISIKKSRRLVKLLLLKYPRAMKSRIVALQGISEDSMR